MYGDQFGEFACGYWGIRVKESINNIANIVTEA